MQPYQNYLNQQNGIQYNPYLSGTYGQQMGYQQPQMQMQTQQLNPLLQAPQQPQVQSQGIMAVVVDDFSKILARDVPMDGQGAFFIKSDGTEAEWRKWDASGEIKPTHFKAIPDSKIGQMDKTTIDTEKLKIDLSENVTGAFMKRFDELSDRLGDLEDILSQARQRGKKKESGLGE